MQCDQTAAADLPECVHSPRHALACDCSITTERLTGREWGVGGGVAGSCSIFYNLVGFRLCNISTTNNDKTTKNTAQGKKTKNSTTMLKQLLPQKRRKSPRKISQCISRSLTGQNKVQKKYIKKKRKTKSQVLKIHRESKPDNQISYKTWWWWGVGWGRGVGHAKYPYDPKNFVLLHILCWLWQELNPMSWCFICFIRFMSII